MVTMLWLVLLLGAPSRSPTGAPICARRRVALGVLLLVYSRGSAAAAWS